jgi:hypothetical protein
MSDSHGLVNSNTKSGMNWLESSPTCVSLFVKDGHDYYSGTVTVKEIEWLLALIKEKTANTNIAEHQ